VTGNGDCYMTGTFYAAKAQLSVTGNGSNDVIGSQYITNTLSVTGNGSFNVIWNPQLVAQPPLVSLVE
jgi:hypothetical protein